MRERHYFCTIASRNGSEAETGAGRELLNEASNLQLKFAMLLIASIVILFKKQELEVLSLFLMLIRG